MAVQLAGQMGKSAILFVSYDGMMEPLGKSQVLGYLERLCGEYDIHLLSFEKPEDLNDKKRYEALKFRIDQLGIDWTPLCYHRYPSAIATAYDIVRGTIVAIRKAREHSIEIVHCRSYVASLIGLTVKRICGAKFIFDMRGFWADERVDGRIWKPNSILYRVAKRFERSFFSEADCIVSLTEAGAREIRQFDYLVDCLPEIEVIPTCTNFDLFRPDDRPTPECFTLGYVGSASTWHLFEEFLQLFLVLKQSRPDSRLLIVNRGEHDFVADKIVKFGISGGDVEIVAAEHPDVPGLMSRMTAGTAIYRPADFSNLARAPTKLAEFLGCGVPCIGSARVGDMDTILESDRVGVVLREFNDTAIRSAVGELIALTGECDIAERCVAAARKRFSIDHGVSQYAKIYNRLSEI